MKKIYWILYLVIIVGLFDIGIVSAQTNYPTPMASTEVMQALKGDLDGAGKWATISFADGTTITSVSGGATYDGQFKFTTGGINTIQSTADVHNTTPTDAELDTAFGTPASVGRGFIGTIDDADGDTNFYLAIPSDGSWYFIKLTKAT